MPQHLYRLWVVLLFISGGIALWFSWTTGVGIWKFFTLNAKAPAKVIHWEVKELPSSRFTVEADYHYEVKGKEFSGKTLFEGRQFLNRFAAENYGKFVESKRWQAWYNEGRPTASSLENEFPQKDLLQALLTVGVFAYFYFARSMVARFVA
jgi:hypothetical protein